MAKLVWREHALRRCTLQALMHYDHDAVTPTGLREEHLIPVQDWCVEHNCGVRTSFDMFKFRNKKEVTAFLLKWGLHEY